MIFTERSDITAKPSRSAGKSRRQKTTDESVLPLSVENDAKEQGLYILMERGIVSQDGYFCA